MKTRFINLTLGFLLGASMSAHAQKFSAEELNRSTIERRAVEAVIWGMPAVNYERMLQAAIDKGAKVIKSSIGHGGELEGSDSHAESEHNLPCTK